MKRFFRPCNPPDLGRDLSFGFILLVMCFAHGECLICTQNLRLDLELAQAFCKHLTGFNPPTGHSILIFRLPCQ